MGKQGHPLQQAIFGEIFVALALFGPVGVYFYNQTKKSLKIHEIS